MKYTSFIKKPVDIKGEEKKVQTLICLSCDLVVSVPQQKVAAKILCPRCNHLLLTNYKAPLNLLISFTLSALIFFLLSLAFPFMSYDASGSERIISLAHSVTTLISLDYYLLAGLLVMTILLLPAGFLGGLLYILLPLKFNKRLPYTPAVLKMSLMMLPWSMVEIFLISVLVSIIKLTSTADIGLGLSFYAFALFSVFMTATVLYLNADQIWSWISTPLPANTVAQGGALKQNLTACHLCHASVPLNLPNCQRCGSKVSARKPYSVQRTWAFLAIAMLLYVPANILPIMQTRIMGKDQFNTIIDGVQVLWNHGSYPIAMIVFIASVIIPITKMLALSWLSFSVMFKKTDRLREKTIAYRIIEFIGRWSMLDVFVVALLVSLIHQGKFLAVYPGPAIIAFAGVVIFTMLATKSFDSRLLWDQREHENHT